MKGKKYTAIILGIMVLLLGFKYYYDNYSSQGILEKVIRQNGYRLNQAQEPISAKLYIKPEWIPLISDQRLSLKEHLLQIHSTDIILDNVWNRGNDIYFSFCTAYDLEYKEGEFLYNGIFNEEGGFSWNSRIDGIVVYDMSGKRVDLGQTGSGPGSDFSFGIQPEDYTRIKDGFYVEYNDFILYQYVRE